MPSDWIFHFGGKPPEVPYRLRPTLLSVGDQEAG
jgi:hypothetical protein